MASKANMNSIPPKWLSDKLENQIVVGSLRAYVRFLENVIEKTETIGKFKPPNYILPRDSSFEDIVETALESHAKIINRRSYRRHPDEMPPLVSPNLPTAFIEPPRSREVDVPLKKPKIEPLDDFIQHIKSVKQEINAPKASPVKTTTSLPVNNVRPPETPKSRPGKQTFSKSSFAITRKSNRRHSSSSKTIGTVPNSTFNECTDSSEASLPLNHATPPDTPEKALTNEKKRKLSKSAFAVTPKEKKQSPSSKVVDVVPRFTFIGGFFATTYNLQRESVALALDFVGIKVELYNVKIIANQNCRMYSLANEDLVRVTFEVDRETTDKILKMFKNDKCDLNFYKETEFSKKNKLTRELSDLDVLKWETMELISKMINKKLPEKSEFRLETDEKSLKLFKGDVKINTIPVDDFLLKRHGDLQQAMEQLVEEGRELMEKYMEELKKKRGFKNEEER